MLIDNSFLEAIILKKINILLIDVTDDTVAALKKCQILLLVKALNFIPKLVFIGKNINKYKELASLLACINQYSFYRFPAFELQDADSIIALNFIESIPSTLDIKKIILNRPCHFNIFQFLNHMYRLPLIQEIEIICQDLPSQVFVTQMRKRKWEVTINKNTMGFILRKVTPNTFMATSNLEEASLQATTINQSKFSDVRHITSWRHHPYREFPCNERSEKSQDSLLKDHHVNNTREKIQLSIFWQQWQKAKLEKIRELHSHLQDAYEEIKKINFLLIQLENELLNQKQLTPLNHFPSNEDNKKQIRNGFFYNLEEVTLQKKTCTANEEIKEDNSTFELLLK